MKVYISLLVIAGALAEKPPYPPSGWKPEGARLVLPSRQQQPQDSYGAPPPPPPSSDYGPPSSGYGPPSPNPPSSGYGPPSSGTPGPATPPQEYGPPRNDTAAPTPEQEDLDKVNEQIMARLRQEEGSDTGVYYVYLPDGRLQRVQYTTAPIKASRQQAVSNPQNNFNYQQEGFGSQVSFGSFAQQRTSYDAPQYPPAAPQPSESSQGNFAENSRLIETPGNPSHLFARYEPASNARVTSPSRADSSQANVEQSSQKAPAKYVASVSFSDVPPITGPVYSFNNQPLTRVVRYAPMFQ
ncbi:Hypothetical protein NTJ_02537 [Nesidiocoris tenuis]|uniref:DUF4794 domain-containing protein n=1 Tax=Nesidiocoris tenuis TaxID=355587 RepID=A0ABN7AFV4_9HEMI|nr:Hypothetical protein NTJ_02537 [Nesidiocoris tenuis]